MAKPLFKSYKQHQTYLFPPNLEEMVAANHPGAHLLMSIPSLSTSNITNTSSDFYGKESIKQKSNGVYFASHTILRKSSLKSREKPACFFNQSATASHKPSYCPMSVGCFEIFQK
jgi:hypothetical protein